MRIARHERHTLPRAVRWKLCKQFNSGQQLVFELATGVMPPEGHHMKIAIALLILLACAQSSLAAGSACHTIESESKRLTCYDAAFPPTIRKPQAVKMD